MKNLCASFVLVLAAVLLILLASLYLQFYEHLALCGLCITQRLLFFIIAIILFIAICHNKFQRAYALGIFVCALAGMYFSGRQIWLQHLPRDQLPSCGPDLSILFQHFPIQAFQELLTGSADCGAVVWEFLGLSLAGWSLICFIALCAFGLGRCFPR
jgi:disulfide bond formation protein DsbB